MWKRYQKVVTVEARPYMPGEDLSNITLRPVDRDRPLLLGMVVRNPEDPDDQWFIGEKEFQRWYVLE